MVDLIVTSSLTHSLMLVLPVALAAGLRRLRCRGWSVLGGLLAGIALGPAGLGAAAPGLYDRFFVHGSDVQEVRPPPALGTRPADEPETWSFQRPFRSYTSAVLVCTFLGAGLVRRRRTAPPPWEDAARRGLAPVAAPAALGLGAAVVLGGWSVGLAAVPATALAAGPWRPPASRTHVAATAGFVANALAVSACALLAWHAVGGLGLLWSAFLLVIPVAWLLPPLPAESGHSAWSAARIIDGALRYALVPSLAACAAMRVDPVADARFWMVAGVTVLIAVAGRAAAVRFGLALRGERVPLAPALGACAPTQLAVAAVTTHLWIVPQAAATGLVAGAAVLALLDAGPGAPPTRSWRRFGRPRHDA